MVLCLTTQPFRLQTAYRHRSTLLDPIWWQNTRCTTAFLLFILYHRSSLNTWGRREVHCLLQQAAAPEVPTLWLLRLKWVDTKLHRLVIAHHFSLSSSFCPSWINSLPLCWLHEQKAPSDLQLFQKPPIKSKPFSERLINPHPFRPTDTVFPPTDQQTVSLSSTPIICK